MERSILSFQFPYQPERRRRRWWWRRPWVFYDTSLPIQAPRMFQVALVETTAAFSRNTSQGGAYGEDGAAGTESEINRPTPRSDEFSVGEPDGELLALNPSKACVSRPGLWLEQGQFAPAA